MYTELTVDATTSDITIDPFTFSKPDCGLSSYSIDGYGASIYDTNIVRFTSSAEAYFSFNLVVTAIGNTPATKSIPSSIKIVDCSNGNVISGGTWQTNLLYTDLTTASITSDVEITPFTYSKPDCPLL